MMLSPIVLPWTAGKGRSLGEGKLAHPSLQVSRELQEHGPAAPLALAQDSPIGVSASGTAVLQCTA